MDDDSFDKTPSIKNNNKKEKTELTNENKNNNEFQSWEFDLKMLNTTERQVKENQKIEENINHINEIHIKFNNPNIFPST